MYLMTSPSRFPSLLGFGLLVVVPAAVAACSASGGTHLGGSGIGSGGGSGGAGTQLGNGGGSGTVGLGNGLTAGAGAGPGTGGVAACAAQPYHAAQLPLDMYIMQDQSSSMNQTVSEGGTKWDAVTGALTSFVQQPGISGVAVGIQYFGLPLSCSGTFCLHDSDCGSAECGGCSFLTCNTPDNFDTCLARNYATPEVEIAPLPGVGSAIVQSLAQHGPSTDTPTGPALQGAIDHAKTWAMSHPGHVVIAVLATDGEPTECSPQDTSSISQIAATALAGTPSIKTFTIGTFASADIPSGPNLLDAIAKAGGTGQAFNIDTTMNVNQSFLDALNKIRGSALGCQYSIPVPEAGTPNFSELNVQYTPGSGAPVEFPAVTDQAHCPASGDAWYYDSNTAPTQIELCPSTCTKVSADTSGSIDILLGCQTVTVTN